MMRRGWVAAAVVLALALAGCGDDGDDGDNRDDASSTGSGSASEEADIGTFGEPTEVDDLTVTVGEPYKGDELDPVVRVEVAFETEGDSVPTPNPTLQCSGEEFEIDHDSANYASEVSAGQPEDGEWAWSPGPDCQEGSFEVGDVTFEFSEVAVQE